MFCEYCGKEINDKDEFCVSCGNKIQSEIGDFKEKEQKNKKNILFLAIGAGAVVLIGLIIMILLLAGGNGEETSHKKENKKEHSEIGNNVSSERTIFDDMVLYETTLREIKQYVNDKGLTYEEGEHFTSPQIMTRLGDSFLGYDAFYKFYTQEIVRLYDTDENVIATLSTREDYLRYEFCEENLREYYPAYADADYEEHTSGVPAENGEPLEDLYVYVAFASDDEFRSGSVEIEEYLEEKSVHKGNVTPFRNEDAYYPLNIIELDGISFVEYIELKKVYSEDELEEYANNFLVLEYGITSQNTWENSKKNMEEGSDEEEAVTKTEKKEATEAAEAESEAMLETEAEETISESEKERIFSKFLGFWIWEDEVDVYKAGGAYNGISIEKYGEGYEISESRGNRWSDEKLTSCSENELIFEWDDEISGHIKVILTYIDENTIEKVYQSGNNNTANRAIKDSALGESEDIDANVEQIKNWYYDTQNRLDNLSYASYGANLDCYFDGGYPAKVVAKSGYNGWNATREYYYHDQKLYFIFVYGDDIGEYRFYVKDGITIRSVSPDGNTANIGYGISPETRDFIEKTFAEEEAFPLMVNCGN